MKQELSVTVPVPADYVLIRKVDFEEMIEQHLAGRQWEMKDLVERTNRSPQWLKDNILYPYKDELLPFVRYPVSKGSRWKFGAMKMSQWLEDNLEKVL